MQDDFSFHENTALIYYLCIYQMPTSYLVLRYISGKKIDKMLGVMEFMFLWG